MEKTFIVEQIRLAIEQIDNTGIYSSDFTYSSTKELNECLHISSFFESEPYFSVRKQIGQSSVCITICKIGEFSAFELSTKLKFFE